MKPLACVFGIKKGIKLSEVRHVVEPRVHEMVIKAMDEYVDKGTWAVQGEELGFNFIIEFGEENGPIQTGAKRKTLWHWPKASNRGIFTIKER